MAGFVTSNDITNLSGAMYKHWQTFSAFSHVVVHKEPTKTLNSSLYSGVTWAGFGVDNVQEENYTYTTVTGVYPAIIIDKNKIANNRNLEDLNIKLTNEQIVIKVERNAKDFLDEGKTEKIELSDGRAYNNFSLYSTQNYFGLIFYYYLLDRTT